MPQSNDLVVNDESKNSGLPRSIVFPFSGREGSLRTVAWRVGIASFCMVATTMIVYLGRGGYRDITGKPITLLDAVYFATVSLSTTGYGDIVPVTQWTRFFSAFLITPLRVVFLIVLVGSTLEVVTRRTQAEFRENRWRKTLRDHTVVIGFGVKGQSAVKTLVDNGASPKQIVVISADTASVEEASRIGCVGILGNARREAVLERAGVRDAQRIVVACDSDDTAVLVTLNARCLAPHATIVAAAREAQNASILRQSGADSVITTAEAAGRIMAISLSSPVAGSLMEDLIDPGQGLEVIERNVDKSEYQQHVGDFADRGEIVLATVRAGEVHRFDKTDIRNLAEGDRIVVIRRVQK